MIPSCCDIDTSLSTETVNNDRIVHCALHSNAGLMLDTLKELLSKMDEDHWFHDQTAQAIAKAEGR
jgi:hypothetical protein